MFGIDTILNVGMKLVDKFFPDPEAKAKAQLELLQMQQNGELAQINADIAEQHFFGGYPRRNVVKGI